MAATTAFVVLLLSSSPALIMGQTTCTTFSGSSNAGDQTCTGSGVVKCIRTKLDTTLTQSCDNNNLVCGAYPDVADGTCIMLPGTNQLAICGSNSASAPTDALFANCPTTPTCNAAFTAGGLYGCGGNSNPTPSPTPAPSPTAIRCMQAVSSNVNQDGTGGSAVATTVADCTASGTIAAGNLGTMCIKTSYRTTNNQSSRSLGLTQGCDLGFCAGITQRGTCCTDSFGTRNICVTDAILTGAPTDSEFANCDATCTNVVATTSFACGRSIGSFIVFLFSFVVGSLANTQ